MKGSCAVIAGVMLTLAVPVCAQSLGDLAKKEAERRKAAAPASKVYTNDDLKKIAVPGDSTPEATTPAAAPTSAQGVKDPKDQKDAKDSDGKNANASAMDENAWRAKITAARDDLRRGEMFREALQSRINGLTADFTARDDPYQRAQIGDERQKALAELDRVNLDLEKARKAIADIEEDARRSSVPAGWLR